MSRNKELAIELQVSAAQAETLIALLDHPVLSYRIVQELQLFPVGKMHERVLAPLQEGGWIIFHSLPPEDDVKGGRPLKAFSLARGKRAALKKVHRTLPGNAAFILRKK